MSGKGGFVFYFIFSSLFTNLPYFGTYLASDVGFISGRSYIKIVLYIVAGTF